MNKTYSLIWSTSAQTWVAAPETARAHRRGRNGARSLRRVLARAAGCGDTADHATGHPGARMMVVAVAALAATLGLPAWAQTAPTAPAPTALPTGGQVVAGQAAITQQAATLTVQQASQRAAVDWKSFDVGADAKVKFVQPSSTSVTLNRVQGGGESRIFGRIQANGQVFLSNPNGVYFAPGASVDVGGLVATTHRIGLDEFMAGKLRFERAGATGSLINEGELKAALGGYIALLAPEVRNQGVVLARMGTVAMAAGDAFELQIDSGRTLAGIRVEASTIRSIVDNRSAVLAPGGLVILSAQAMDRVQGGVVKNSGRVEATGLAQRGGRIVLEASGQVANSARVNASATAEGPAGSVEVKAAEVVNSGVVEARGSDAHPVGGRIAITAGTVTQTAEGTLDASAPAQGGTVDIHASGQVTIGGRVDVSAGVGKSVAATMAGAAAATATTGTGSATATTTSGAATAAAPAPLAQATPLSTSTSASPTTSVATTSPATATGTSVDATGLAIAAADTSAPQGTLLAPAGGQVRVRAAAIRIGTAQIDTSGDAHGGSVLLDASAPAHDAPPAPQPAPAPGQVALIGGTQISARGSRGRGGAVTLLGEDLTLGGMTSIDATGGAAGGDVRVGGGWQGGEGLHQARRVSMEAGTRIDASAIDHGAGGSIVLWADAHAEGTLTQAHGALVARGGANGGGGGRIETSAYVVDHAGIHIDAGAAAGGRAGQWLIDPAVANIDQATANTWATTLQTTDVTNDVSGNITWGAGVTLTKTSGSGATTLTLRSSSGGGITLSGANISSTAGALNLLLWTRYGTSGSAGLIDVQNSSISTNGGSVWMGGGDASGSWNGLAVGNSLATTWSQGVAAVSISNTTLLTGAGSIALKGQAFYSGGGGGTSTGVQVYQGSTLRTTTGSIEIDGEVRGTYQYGMGVQIGNVGGATLETTTGSIRITGFGTDSGGPTGWRIATLINSPTGYSTTLRTTTGSITLDGAASFANHANDSTGLAIGSAGTTKIVSGSGAISLAGSNTANASQFLNGIRFSNANVANSIQIGQDASSATDSTSNISVTADSLLQRTNQPGTGSISMRSKGTLTIAPKGASFTALRADASNTLTFDDDWNFGTALTGFTLGKSGNTFATTFSNALSVAGPISFYTGQFTLSGSLTSSATGDIWIEAKSVANPGMQISGNISKTGGANSTLTLRSDGRLNIGSAATISGSSTTPLNVVIWSDYINTNTGGVTLAGTFNTFGGHLWAGGSSTANGSDTWNGLTVGDGPSSAGFNANSMDFSAAITTAGGNVMLWSGANGNNTMGASGAMSVNAGAGDITIRANKVNWPGMLPITTTGTFTLEPDVVGGSFGQSMSTGWFNLSGATPGGLVIGGSGNTQTISINATQTVHGPITLMGGGITVNNALTSTGTGDITLQSKGDITLNAGIAKTATTASKLKLQANGHITVNGVDLTSSSGRMDTVLISDFDANGVGSIILDGSANASHGVAITTQGGHVWMGGNAGGTANGTTQWNDLAVGTGYAQSSNSTGSGIAALTLNNANIRTSGGDVSLAGRSWRYDVDRVGIYLYQSSIDTGAGSIELEGRITAGSLGTTPQLRPLYIRSSTLTATTGDITLTGGEAATDSSDNSNGTGLWLGNSSVTTTGATGGNITLTGTTGRNNGQTWRHGLVMSADGANAEVAVSTVAGNINIIGTSNATSRADSSGIKLQTSQPTNTDATRPKIKIVSQTGNITITGDNPANTDTSASATGFTANGSYAGQFLIGYDGVNAYSGNTTLNARSLYVYSTTTGYLQFGGTGALTIAPTAASFATGGTGGATRTSTFDTQYSFGTGHKSITLGKDDNLGGMTISSGITAAGPLSIYGGRIDITAPLTVSKAGSALLAKSSGLIYATTAAGTLQTNGGPLILWSNAANLSSGTGAAQIEIQDGVTLKSQGGKLVLAGGLDDGSNGGTKDDGIPDGYAWNGASTTSTGGVSLGYAGAAGSTGVTLDSAGGDILVRGASGGSAVVPGVTGQAKFRIDSGTGAITMVGNSSTHTGLQFSIGQTANFAISSAKTSGTAISLTGNSTSTGGYLGIMLNSGGLIQATGAAGGIDLIGTSKGTTDAIKLADAQILAAGGGITVNAVRSTAGSALTLFNTWLGNRRDATAINGVTPTITASSANVTLLSNATTFTSAPTVSTTGTFTIAPTSDAFSAPFIWGGTTASDTFTGTDSVANLVIKGTSTLGGLTTGKSTSTANAGITVKNPIDIGGLVSLYGGSLAINANIKSSASTGGVLLNTDAISFGAGALVQSPGTLTIQPQSKTSTVAVGGGTGTLAASSAWFNGANRNFVDGFSLMTIGRSDSTAALTVGGALTVSDDLKLRTGTGSIALNGAITTAGNALLLDTAGSVTQTAAYSTGGLALLGGGSFALTHAANNAATLAANAGTISVRDADALAIGTVKGTAGLTSTSTIDVATLTGNLTLGADIKTTNATASAVVLNAGLSAAAGTATGGDLLVTGTPTITVGQGGFATLYSGSVAGSTGLKMLVGVGSGRFRYASDEQTTGYTLALSAGTNAIFREQPTVTRIVDDKTIVYGGTWTDSFTLGNGQNGDTFAQAFETAPTVTTGGTQSTSGHWTAGAHALTGSGGSDMSRLGYAVTPGITDGTLTVTPRALTSTWAAVDKVYDGTTVASISYLADDRIAGDVLSLSTTGATFDDRHAGAGKTVTVQGLTFTGADAANYSAPLTNTSASITPKALTLSASKVYDGTTTLGAGTVSFTGLVGTETLEWTGATASDAHVATAGKFVSAITLADASNGSGGKAGDYQLPATLDASSAPVTITPATLTPTLTNAAISKAYDGTTDAPSALVPAWSLTGLASGDATTLNATSTAYNSKDVADARTLTFTGLSLGPISGSHASQTSDYVLGDTTYAAAATITPKVLGAITGLVAQDKTYDGTTSATVTNWGAVTTGVGSETVTVSGAYASFDAPSAGSRTVSASGYTLGNGGNGGLAANYRLGSDSATGSATINKAELTVIANDDAKFVVFADTAGFAGVSYAGFVHGETTATAGLTGMDTVSVARPDAATNTTAGTYAGALMPVTNALASGNYSFRLQAGTFTIVPADQLLVRVTPLTTPYGGASNYAVSSTYLQDAGGGNYIEHSVPLSESAGRYTVNDGQGSSATFLVAPVTPSNSSSGQLNVGSYSLTASDIVTNSGTNFSNRMTLVGNRTVQTQALSLSVGTVQKVYDGTTALTGTALNLSGMVAGDSVTVGGSGAFASRNAGTGLSYTIGNLALSGADAGNYFLTGGSSYSGTNGEIGKLALSTAWTAANKVYDGNATAAVTAGTDARIAGDAIAWTASSASFANANAGVGKTVTIAQALTGADAGNYTVAATATTTADITPKALTVTATKVYDGTTALDAAHLTLAGLVGSETLVATGTASDAHVATFGKYVTALTLADGSNGGLKDNYALPTLNAANAPVTITPRPLSASATITGATTKVYDGSTAATGASIAPTLSGAAPGDTVALDLAGVSLAYDSAHVADATQIAATGAVGLKIANSSHGSLASDYAFSAPSVTPVAATITPAALTVALANSGVTKVYDGTTGAPADFTPLWSIGGLGAGDSVTIASSSAAYDAKDVGSASKVTVGGLSIGSITGTGRMSDYRFAASSADVAATITRRAVSIADLTVADKVYDGNTSASVVQWGTVLTGVAGESLNVTPGTTQFADANAGVDKQLVIQGMALADGTGLAANYALPASIASAASITPKVLTLQASKAYDGTTTLAPEAVTLAGFVGSETVVVASATASDAHVATPGKFVSAVTFANGSNGGLASNYAAPTLDAEHAPVTITPRALHVSYTGLDKVYDGHTNANVATSDDRIGGDVLSVDATASYADKNVGTGKVVSVTSTTLSGSGASDYTLATPTGSTTAAITRLDTVTWIGGADGNWFDPANWQGGAVPDLGNVAHVVIPDGTTVKFDTTHAVAPADASAPVHIDSLGGGSLAQTDGNLQVGPGGVKLDSLTQDGGTLHSQGNVVVDNFAQTNGQTVVDGNFTVQQDFAQGPGGSVVIGGDASITDTHGGTILGNLDVAGDLGVTSNDGSITQVPGTALTVDGATTVDAGANDVILTNPGNNFVGPFNANGNDIAVVDGSGGLVLGDIQASGNLDAQSTDGSITQTPDGTITVAGETTVDAGANDVILTNPTNDFVGPFNANGNDIAVVDGNGGLVLGDIQASGKLDATSSDGNITQTPDGSITVGGETTVDAGANDVILTNPGNDFVGPFNAIGKDIAVVDGHGGLVLGDVQASGSLDATSSDGNITQTPDGSITVGGTTFLDAGSSNIALTNPTNDFVGPFHATGRDIAVVDGFGGLVLGTITASGNLDATALTGSLSQAAGSQIRVAGTATLGAPAGQVRLNGEGNVFGTLLTNAGVTDQTVQEQIELIRVPTPPILALPQRFDAPPALEVLAPQAQQMRSRALMVEATQIAASGWVDELTITVPRETLMSGFSFDLPQSLKEGLQQDEEVSMRRASGRALPAWLAFDARGLRLTASPVTARSLPARLRLTLGGRTVTVVIQAEASTRAGRSPTATASAATGAPATPTPAGP